MSRKFKEHYSGYSRIILSEIMSEKELNDLDRKYTQAKLDRFKRKVLGKPVRSSMDYQPSKNQEVKYFCVWCDEMGPVSAQILRQHYKEVHPKEVNSV